MTAVSLRLRLDDVEDREAADAAAEAESVNALYKTELHRNPAVLAADGGHWRGLADLEIATCAWVTWFNTDRLHGELDDATPAEVEAAHYRALGQANAA